MEAGSKSPANSRRTQAERRAATRGRLLDATIESLIDVGYAGTTVREVTERAGVSVGAQSHHFPQRLDLIASAFEHLAEQRIARYRERAVSLGGARQERLRALLDLLWEDFSSPFFTVAAKLWVAASDDAELRERLVPVERRIHAAATDATRAVAGELAAEPDFDRLRAVVTNAIAGLAMVRQFDPSGRAARGEPWRYHRAALEALLERGLDGRPERAG